MKQIKPDDLSLLANHNIQTKLQAYLETRDVLKLMTLNTNYFSNGFIKANHFR